jgi:hypothetical protein
LRTMRTARHNVIRRFHLRRIFIILTIITTIFLASSAMAADVNGLWKETTWPGGADNSWIAFTQEGNKVEMILVGILDGKVVTYQGSGWIQGNLIKYEVHMIKNPGAWGEHSHIITLSSDGNTMNGRAENPQGGGSNFKFVRVK